MKRIIIPLLFIHLFFLSCQSQEKTITIKILQTSDVHGALFPYDFIENKTVNTSLEQVYTYVQQQRENEVVNGVLLLDNGDNLQGQPTVYYYNFIDTVNTHILARMMNFMDFDATSLGNHDIEAGHSVYDRVRKQYDFPMLCANIIETSAGKPYFTPYKVFELNGAKIAVLGLVTPHIPHWLPENLWSGMQFTDMLESARHWVKLINETEKPHILIGLFHAGYGSGELLEMDENASLLVAKQIPDFDAVFIGHDHQKRCEKIVNSINDSVWILNPASNARYIAELALTLTIKGNKLISKYGQGQLIDVSKLNIRSELSQFSDQFNAIKEFVSKPIGIFTKTISSRDAYFGPSAFVDLIHTIQLDIAKADISFAAPLSFDTGIKADTIYIRDMFKLYKYENMLYAMELTGQEVKDFLEFSYGLWLNQMKSPDDHLLLLYKKDSTSMRNGRFINPSYNFDSAAGIIYEVDVTKPLGSRVRILKMANGQEFQLNKKYRVAINSYRGNGGGDHLIKGAGIPKDELNSRIVYATDVDLRYYLMKWIEDQKIVNPVSLNEWKIIPENWVKPAAKRDYELLFGKR
ncbi:MAG: 5'-nucleotidase C-terminal domain-containing protein [Prevotellaceae bacterium]|jgi:2',3'-cyclic-nucleotide 2'-phosphodiesterase/3'-nucleotidase|nr:5'-nucleotidase C-terminal domain-containing protein [Prevotellaceae bacterium]